MENNKPIVEIRDLHVQIEREPEETTALPEETTAPPEETTAPPEETTAPPEETTIPQETVYYSLGDVNRDGKIKAQDARLALRISARLEQADEFTLLLADANRDGKVKAGDARLILRASARIEALPDERFAAPA